MSTYIPVLTPGTCCVLNNSIERDLCAAIFLTNARKYNYEEKIAWTISAVLARRQDIYEVCSNILQIRYASCPTGLSYDCLDAYSDNNTVRSMSMTHVTFTSIIQTAKHREIFDAALDIWQETIKLDK